MDEARRRSLLERPQDVVREAMQAQSPIRQVDWPSVLGGDPSNVTAAIEKLNEIDYLADQFRRLSESVDAMNRRILANEGSVQKVSVVARADHRELQTSIHNVSTVLQSLVEPGMRLDKIDLAISANRRLFLDFSDKWLGRVKAAAWVAAVAGVGSAIALVKVLHLI